MIFISPRILILNQFENKDLVKENQRLFDRIKILEDESLIVTQSKESLETEWNRLRNINISQLKDLENLRKQIEGMNKEAKKNVILFINISLLAIIKFTIAYYKITIKSSRL